MPVVDINKYPQPFARKRTEDGGRRTTYLCKVAQRWLDCRGKGKWGRNRVLKKKQIIIIYADNIFKTKNNNNPIFINECEKKAKLYFHYHDHHSWVF